MSLHKFKDKDWRMNNLYKIINKDAKLVKFIENPVQSQIRKAPGRIKEVLKARQMGVTAGATIDLFDQVIWTPNFNGMVLCHKSQDRDKIFQKVQIAFKEMHPTFKPVIDRGGGSKFELRFPEINSRIFIDIENRGDTVHRIHISEAAFCDPERVRATLGAVVPTANVTYESTPNGMKGDFYEHWVNPKSNRTKLFFPWFFQPEYRLATHNLTKKNLTAEEKDFINKSKENYGLWITLDQIAWRRAQIQEHDKMFFQEFPENDVQCFLASGACPVDQEFVAGLMKDLQEPVTDDGTLKVWRLYNKEQRYIISCDVAEGVKSDYSVVQVWCHKDKELCAEFRSNTIKPFQLAKKIVEIAEMYHAGGRPWPLVGVERNNHGHAVLEALHNIHLYANLYEYKEGEKGWLTNLVTRPIMIDTFIDGLESEMLKIHSAEVLGECLTLVDNKGKIEADEGHHDDSFICACIGLQMIMTDSVSDIYDNLTQKVLM